MTITPSSGKLPVITFGAPSALENSPILLALEKQNVAILLRSGDELFGRIGAVSHKLRTFVLEVPLQADGETAWVREFLEFENVKFIVCFGEGYEP